MKSQPLSFTAAVVLLLVLPAISDATGQVSREYSLPHFLFPSFREGIVIMKDQKRFSAMLNYNLLEQRMVTEFNGTYRYSKDPKLIDTIYIDGRPFVPVEDIFYEILSVGKFPLFVQNYATFVAAGHDVGYGDKSQSTGPTRHKRFEMNSYWGDVAYLDLPADGVVNPTPLYWIGRDGVLEKFSNGRHLIRLFPDYRQALQEFIDKEKINFKSSEDVSKLGSYLNNISGKHPQNI